MPRPGGARGGAGSAEHMYQVLTDGKADAALAASIFHFNEYSVPNCKKRYGRPRLRLRTSLFEVSGIRQRETWVRRDRRTRIIDAQLKTKR